MPTEAQNTTIGKTKKPKARAWNAGGWMVFFRDGTAEYNGAKSVEDAISLYPDKVRRKIMAVVLSDAFPRGSMPIETDLAFVVIKTRVAKSQALIPRREVRL